jgi:hypothetical protein
VKIQLRLLKLITTTNNESIFLSLVALGLLAGCAAAPPPSAAIDFLSIIMIPLKKRVC